MNDTHHHHRLGTPSARLTTPSWQPFLLVSAVALAGALALAPRATAQTARFRAAQVRVTVPLGYTNSTVITNWVNVSGLDSNNPTPVTFDVSGLPPGAAAVLTDTNGNSLLSTTIDTNLWLTLNTTNIAEGVYTFSLNASGGATNHVFFVLQAAHVWNVGLDASNVWSQAASWATGVPGPTSDVVFGEFGAQTNLLPNNLYPTNSFVDVDTTIASLRFSQTGFTNSIATDTNARPISHSLRINPGKTLTITGTNGFGLMRDYVDDLYAGLSGMSVNISGGAGAKMVITNTAANFAILVGASLKPSLTMSNLENMATYVSRMGLAEYQLYPNYANYNYENVFNSNPRRFIANVSLARTNLVKASYVNPENYTNELTRAYGVTFQDSETQGVGSDTPTFLYLGQSNAFFADGVCFIRANHAGTVRFNTNYANGTALFRGTNGGRMAVFTVSDDGGTNYANSNVKSTIDFASGNGSVDILADRLYVSRDRTLIVSNQSPNVQGDLFIGKGIVDVNTAILGFQEHDGKTNWTDLFGAQAYLNYCEGRLTVTNGGTFRVNGTLTLGYTADTNPSGSAQQQNTYGQITIYSNCTVSANTIVVDGGLNMSTQDRITMTRGSLIVSNTLGAPPGLPLERLSMDGSTLTVFLDPSRTNVYVTTLLTPGTSPSIIKVAGLTGVTAFPAQIPVIAYGTASPFLVADVTALGAGYVGYVLNNIDNSTVDVFITTNAPHNLLWRGNISANWDTTTFNWVTVVGNLPTNFTLGDSVTFDDSSTVNNINISGSVVPGQTGAGVIVSNTARAYSFANGTIAGTSLLVKRGNNTLTMDATKQGPINVTAGSLNGGGTVGFATVYSNAVFTFDGLVNGGLISTGKVAITSSGSVSGPVSIQGGSLVNDGTISTAPGTMTIAAGVAITNNNVFNVAGGNWDLPNGSVLANHGTVNLGADHLAGRINFEGTVYGEGAFYDVDGGLTGVDARFSANPLSIWSPGTNLYNSIGTEIIGARIDLNNTPGTAPFGVAQLRIEVDFNNPQTNDIVYADKWNNITGMLLMTNINPGAGSFTAGQVFQVFANNNGLSIPNTIDVNGTYPLMWPPVPAPGLQWGLYDFRAFGTVSVTNTPLVWDGTGGGTWDTNTANTPWKGGKFFSDNQGAMFDDSASGSTVVNVLGVLAPGGFAITTNIVAGVTNFFTNGPAMSPGIVISNATKDYVFAGAGKISGITGLYKTGPGTLSLLGTNDYVGNTIIDGGTIVLTNAGAAATVLSIGTSGNNNELLIDGATVRYTGTTNVNLNSSVVINPGGATFDVPFATNEFYISGKNIVGSGALTKIGPGTLGLFSASDNYPGGTTVSAGTLRLTAAAAGSGTLTLQNSATLQLTNAFTLTNVINVAGPTTTIRVLGGNSVDVLSGNWTGSGGVTVNNTNLLTLNGDMSAFSGTVSFGASSGTFKFNNTTNSNNCTGSALATFDLGTSTASLSNLNGAGLTYNLGALTGSSGTVLAGRSTNSAAPPGTTYSIGANGSNTVFAGKILNGMDTVSVVKVGSGTLALNGNNAYTGSTTVSAGTLAGNGSIAGPVTVQAGGTLSPGQSIGTFGISNSLSLAGNMVVEVSRNGGVLSNDKVVGLTSVSFGGTLTVSNVGPSALQGGDTFQLFSLGGSGNFANVVAPALASSYLVWHFEPTTGALSVVDTRPILTFSRSGNSVSLNWTNSGYLLQVQTNSLSTGVSTNWVTYPGGGSSPVTVPLDAVQGTVFFRLISTP